MAAPFCFSWSNVIVISVDDGITSGMVLSPLRMAEDPTQEKVEHALLQTIHGITCTAPDGSSHWTRKTTRVCVTMHSALVDDICRQSVWCGGVAQERFTRHPYEMRVRSLVSREDGYTKGTYHLVGRRVPHTGRHIRFRSGARRTTRREDVPTGYPSRNAEQTRKLHHGIHTST